MSNYSQVFYEKVVLMNFIGKNLSRSPFFNKVSSLPAKERLSHKCFPVSFTKHSRMPFFSIYIWVTVSPKYPFLFVTTTSATKNVSFNLVYFKYFQDKHCEKLFVEVLDRKPAVTKLILLIEQVTCLKCCWKSEAVAQLSSVKLRFCETSQISQNTSKMEFLFCKYVSPQACNSNKKETVIGVFLWIYLCEYALSFYFFCFRKDKSSHWRCSVKKGVLKNCANSTGKHLCWSLFLIKLQVFKNTYFEEHLWTTACKKINICLIVKVLFPRIKFWTAM